MTDTPQKLPFDLDDAIMVERLPAMCWPEWNSRVGFENRGIDVEITANVSIGLPSGICEYELPYALQCLGEKDTFTIEVKPNVGDDYPVVLRQMLAGKVKYLFLERYTGIGATIDQFIDIFAASGRVVIFKSDVDERHQQLSEAGEWLTPFH